MYKKESLIFLIVFVLLFSIPLSLAQNTTKELIDYSFVLTDQNGNPFSDSILFIDVTNQETNITQEFNKFMSNSKLTLRMYEGDYLVKIYLKGVYNESIGYFTEKQLLVGLIDKNESVVLIPVAYIRGTVVDMYDNLIPNAELKLDCSTGFTKYPAQTDSFGSFSIAFVPMGSCKIYANNKEDVTMYDLLINESKVYDVELQLKKKAQNYGVVLVPVFVFALMIILIIAWLVYYFILRKSKKQDEMNSFESDNTLRKKNSKAETDKKPEENDEDNTNNSDNNEEDKDDENKDEITGNPDSEDLKVTKQMKAVINTFDDYEKEVVTLLIKNKGTMTQSKIRYSTGIPKTSLFRCLQRLEQKNIIITENLGKMKTVKLKDTFLSGN